MSYSSGSSVGFAQTQQGLFIQQQIAAVLNNPLLGATVLHYRAVHVEDAVFDSQGQPDYLNPSAGVYASGIDYIANPSNPLRGVFCKPKLRPFQDKGGIYYQADGQLYLANDPGEVYVLHPERPKRQDRFVIAGGVYYAAGPTFPCQMGDTVALFQIDLVRERYLPRTDGLPN